MKAIINIDAYRNSVFGALMQYESFFNDCMPGLGDALVGAKAYRPSPPGWVAEITGFDIKYKYERRFLLGKYDYSLAAASGKGRVIENGGRRGNRVAKKHSVSQMNTCI
jgi:hypothetical protein